MKTLVVLLGWGSIKESYKEFINIAPSNWQIILLEPDQVIDKPFKTDPAEKLVAILDKQGIKKCNLLGHSLGGAIAIQTALKYPERIEHLFLINSEGVYEDIQFSQTSASYMRTGFHNFKKEGVLFLKALTKIIPHPFYHYKLGKYAHAQDLLEQAQKITVPTTIFWGDKDVVIPPHQGRKLHKAIKNSRFILLKNHDHNWIMNYPQLFWSHF